MKVGRDIGDVLIGQGLGHGVHGGILAILGLTIGMQSLLQIVAILSRQIWRARYLRDAVGIVAGKADGSLPPTRSAVAGRAIGLLSMGHRRHKQQWQPSSTPNFPHALGL